METVPYETQEEYEVQEPYQAVEYFTDTVPVSRSVPYTAYEIEVHDAPFGEYYSSCGSSCSCTDHSFWTGNCIQCTCENAVTKYRDETVYEEIQKERPVTKYRSATKYRTITKYREEQKSREVLKSRMENREVEVNWLFGFKVPYTLHVAGISG